MVNNIQVWEPHMNEWLVGEDEIKDVHSGNVLVWDRDNARLPKWFQEVEYIESSWTQYIKTLITPTTSTRFKTKFRIISKLTEYDVLIWATSDSFNKRYYVWWRNSSWWNTNWVYLFTPTNNYNSTNVIFWSVWVDYELQYMWTTLSDWIHSDNINHTTAPSKELYIFAENQNDWWAVWFSNSRLYYLQLYNWTTLIRDFVPCYRKSGREVGLYDLVEKKFYTNAWSWTFTKWPNI